MSWKRPRSESPGGDGPPVVFISNSIEDRGSTHIGLYSPSITAKQLQARPDVKEASHRIAAWRTPGKQRSLSGKPIHDLGHDDDGEQYAGKKLEKLLTDLNVEGAVVVARWYGGILLGPVRFQHFENCAREAISKWKQSIADETKKRKVEKDERLEKEKLAKVLEQRDASITVLRDLLAEKKSTVKLDRERSPQPIQSQDSSNKTDYSMMDLPTLKRLEKARDGTLTWILKQIDKTEEAQKTKEVASDTKVSAEEAQKRSEEFEAAEDKQARAKVDLEPPG
jgi:putative IMPACT (imprinted ancient) family translation regulator